MAYTTSCNETYDEEDTDELDVEDSISNDKVTVAVVLVCNCFQR